MPRPASTFATAALGALASLQTASALQIAQLDNATSGSDNVCMMGHLAPEYFLLGVPKGGTTYFFEDFARSPALVNYIPGPGEEAWHAKEAWVFAPQERDVSQRSEWLKHYPACTKAERKVAFDGTPGYFGCKETPKNIYNFYEGTGYLPKLVFMVFLRNPISRTHSHFYHYIENGVRKGAFGSGCPADVYPETFQQAVGSVLKTGNMCGECMCNDVFQDSMYADSFRNYFALIEAAQFHVVPFEAAVKPELVTYAWDVLKMPHGTGAKSTLVGNGDGGSTNHHDYPSLEEDLDGTVRGLFSAYMQRKTGPQAVASTLVNKGAHLYAFEGDESKQDDIAFWLEKQWGA